MSNYKRVIDRSDYFFFTVVTHNRRKFLTDSKSRASLKIAMEQTRAEYPFEIIAICLLPEHLHCVMKLPHTDKNYSLRWSLIKKRFTRRYLKSGGYELEQSDSRKNHRHRGVWQKRFWEHQIRDHKDLNNHINYVHFNPVKHRLTKELTDWPWSTYHDYVKSGRYGNVNLKQMQEGIENIFVKEFDD